MYIKGLHHERVKSDFTDPLHHTPFTEVNCMAVVIAKC